MDVVYISITLQTNLIKQSPRNECILLETVTKPEV